MDPKQYQVLAARTMCNQEDAIQRMAGPTAYAVTYRADVVDTHMIQANHAIVGIMGEAGELAQLLEKHVYYGKELDRRKIAEEIGDTLWYIAELCNALSLDLGAIMVDNIAKLQARYPEKFTYDRAARENRDLSAEQRAMGKQHTFASMYSSGLPTSIEQCGGHAPRVTEQRPPDQSNPFGYEDGRESGDAEPSKEK